MSDTGFILLQGPLAIPDAGRGPGCVEAVMSSQTPSDNEGGSPAAGLGVSPQRSASFGNSHWKQTASATTTPPSGAGPLPATDQSGQAKAAVPHPPLGLAQLQGPLWGLNFSHSSNLRPSTPLHVCLPRPFPK